MIDFLSKIGKKTTSLDGIVGENSVLASKGLQLFTQKSDSDSNQILPTANALECSTFLSKDTISTLEQGVKYATSKIPKNLAPAYCVYTSNGKYKFTDQRVSDFKEAEKNGSNGWNLEPLLERAEGLTSAQKANLNVNLKEYADFMSSETYKQYASSSDVAPAEYKQTVQNCLDVCDYMNFGYSIVPESEVFTENSVWSEAEYVNNSETGFYGEVFVNPDTKELIIGYCGTNDTQDAVTDDLDMMLKEVPDQYQDALNLYLKYANDPQYADYKISITGHSLGASLAQLVGATDGVMNGENPPIVATFNAFGTYDIVEKNKSQYNFVEQESLNDASMYNYITESDLVSCTSRHVGQTTWVENQSPVAHMTTSLHLGLTPEKYDIDNGKKSMLKETIGVVSKLFKRKK